MGILSEFGEIERDLRSRIATLEAELLRVRTTGHAAAHELDNIAVECGLGHSPKPGEVAAHVRQLREASSEFMKEHNALCDGLNKLIDEHGGWDEDLETYEAHFRKIIAAEREAVRVWKEKHKVLVAEVDAWRTWRTRVVRYMTAEQPDPTPLIENLKSAIAATDAAKAREGARA